LIGAAFGIGFFGLLLYWISIVGVIAWILLVLMQAAFTGAFGALWAWLAGGRRLGTRALAAAAGWIGIIEYLRSVVPLRGFTWGHLSQSQHNVPYLLKAAGLAGGWGIGFLLVIVNVLLAEALWRARAGERVKGTRVAVLAIAILALPLLMPAPSADGVPVTIAIVQGNVPDRPVSFAKELAILRSHAHLTEELPEEVDLVVWPESAVGIDPTREPVAAEIIAGAARSVGVPMIIGGNLDLPDDKYQVMAFLVSPEGDIIDQYQKTHLVPFGEYVPAREQLDWIPALDQVPRDAIPGDEPTVFSVAGGMVAPVISFEGDFGSLVRERIDVGGRLLVVATNTSTWELSWASAQHVAMSQVRAAENGVFVAHGALSGISAFIEPGGRILERSQLFSPAVLIEELRFATSISFYARTGDWLPIGCLLAVGLAILASLGGRLRQRQGRAGQKGTGPLAG
jgi:apolipoprotein N-acyltransferase